LQGSARPPFTDQAVSCGGRLPCREPCPEARQHTIAQGLFGGEHAGSANGKGPWCWCIVPPTAKGKALWADRQSQKGRGRRCSSRTMGQDRPCDASLGRDASCRPSHRTCRGGVCVVRIDASPEHQPPKGKPMLATHSCLNPPPPPIRAWKGLLAADQWRPSTTTARARSNDLAS